MNVNAPEPRISQLLSSMKCSLCEEAVDFRRLDEHMCKGAPAVPALPAMYQNSNKNLNNISKQQDNPYNNNNNYPNQYGQQIPHSQNASFDNSNISPTDSGYSSSTHNSTVTNHHTRNKYTNLIPKSPQEPPIPYSISNQNQPPPTTPVTTGVGKAGSFMEKYNKSKQMDSPPRFPAAPANNINPHNRDLYNGNNSNSNGSINKGYPPDPYKRPDQYPSNMNYQRQQLHYDDRSRSPVPYGNGNGNNNRYPPSPTNQAYDTRFDQQNHARKYSQDRKINNQIQQQQPPVPSLPPAAPNSGSQHNPRNLSSDQNNYGLSLPRTTSPIPPLSPAVPNSGSGYDKSRSQHSSRNPSSDQNNYGLSLPRTTSPNPYLPPNNNNIPDPLHHKNAKSRDGSFSSQRSNSNNTNNNSGPGILPQENNVLNTNDSLIDDLIKEMANMDARLSSNQQSQRHHHSPSDASTHSRNKSSTSNHGHSNYNNQQVQMDICGYCNHTIDSSPMWALGRPWHPEHLLCAQCEKPIDPNIGHVERKNKVYCPSDFADLFLPKCRSCGLPVEREAVSASDGKLEGKWHVNCFGCHTCHQPFPDRSFYVFGNAPYCKRHYHELNNSLCKNCDEPIE
ncbi:10933_t:CDS:2, partial [Ambispora gerdemannii]